VDTRLLSQSVEIGPVTLLGLPAVAQKGVALPFIAAVIRRRELGWLPEGRADSLREALVEGLRQAALMGDWPVEPGAQEAQRHDSTVIPNAQQLLSELRWALESAQADRKLMAHVSGEPEKLERGMSVYVSRVELSRDSAPW